jgi:septum formation protein
MNTHHLLLASQSTRRRELLALLGLPFETTAPNVVETPQTGEPPAALVARLSQAKARAACSEQQTPSGSSPSVENTIIIACDTVVAMDGEMLGKPRDATEATTTLRRLRRQTHAVYSAITLLEPATGHTLTDVAQTKVTMRPYTDAEIDAYVVSGDPMDKAGAYGIQHPGFHPVTELRGCYANVMGLPLCHLARCLRAWGAAPLRDVPTVCQASTGHNCPIYETILNDR